MAGSDSDDDQMGTGQVPMLARSGKSAAGQSGPVRMPSQAFPAISGVGSGAIRTGEPVGAKALAKTLVGREEELGQLDAIFSRAVDYQAPQLVTVLGGQGIGKTRLMSEWLDRVVARYAGDPAACPRVYRGRATVNAGAYSLVRRLLRDRFNLLDTDDDSIRLEKVRTQVTEVFSDRRMTEVMHFLGRFLDLKIADNAFIRAVSFGEDSRHEEAIARTVLRRFLELDAARSPLVLVFDDVHLGDELSLTLLGELAEGLGGSAVMLLAAGRQELFVRAPRWGTGTVDHTRLDLHALGTIEAEKMLRQVLSRAEPVPQVLIEDAVELTSGNPYFIEELVRVFLTNGTITILPTVGPTQDGERWRLDAARAAKAELPVSIDGAIQARIAALSSLERDLLERAATIGTVFWLGALVVLGRAEGELQSPTRESAHSFGIEERARLEAALEELIERDYLLAMPDSSVPGDHEYIFKHNLEHQLVLRLISPTRGKAFYRRGAEWIETRMPRVEQSGEQLEYLASLYEKGGDLHRASEVYLAAADKARTRYANGVAVELYERGLRLLGEEDALPRIDPLHNYGDVLHRCGRLTEALVAFRSMLEVAYRLDHVSKCGAALGRIARIHRARGELVEAEKNLDQALGLFRAAEDIRGVAGVEDDLGRVAFLRGAYADALDRHARALDLRRALGDKRSIALSLHNLALAHQASGGHGQAMARFHEALSLRREAGDQQGMVHSLLAVATAWRDRDDPRRAVEVLEEARALVDVTGERPLEAVILTRLGEALAQLAQRTEALDRLVQAVDLARTFGDRLTESEGQRLRAEILLELDQYKEAREAGRLSLDLAEKLGSRSASALAHRVLGAVASRSGGADHAETDAHFDSAVETLRELGAELELARTYHWYARVLDRRGDRDGAERFEGRAGEITQRFTSSHATPEP